MTYDHEKHHRRSIRLRGYDYSQVGAYFVTICTQDRVCSFGDIADGEMQLNDVGRMIQSVWNELPVSYSGVETDEFVVMPNHIHGIVILVGATPRGRPETGSGNAWDCGQARGPAPTSAAMSLMDVVSRFKTLTTKRYADGVRRLGWPAFRGRLWQRNYYEHIIRDEVSLARIREYIANNPAKWSEDRENPEFKGNVANPGLVPSGGVGASSESAPTDGRGEPWRV